MIQPTDTLNPIWGEKWDKGTTGWHVSRVNKFLEEFFPKIASEESQLGGKRIFVPLCGKTVDMKWLYDKGLTVIGIEAIEKPCLDFFNEHGMEYKTDNYDSYTVYSSNDSKLKIFKGNLFQFNDSHYGGKFDLFWDRGSLEAMEVADQQRYVDHMSTLVKDNGCGLLEVCEYDRSLRNMQPFPLYKEDLTRLFKDLFVYDELTRVAGADVGMTINCNETSVLYKVSKR